MVEKINFLSAENSPKPFTPPMMNGVSASKVFLPPLSAQPTSILEHLTQQFPHIHASEWLQRFKDQLVYDQYGNILSPSSAYIPNSHVFYYRFLAHEIHVPFQHHILFENDHFIAVDKPHFLTISPTGQYVQETLLVRLKHQTQNEDLTPIHRLDRETAGIVLFSKNPTTRGLYQQLFAERSVQKTYHAIAPFNPKITFPQQINLHMEKGQPFYTMQICEGNINSSTDISILEHNQYWAKYLLKPHTGKQHQLRVHLNSLGLAIKNDPFYPHVIHKAKDDFKAPLQLLAYQIEFQDPVTQQNYCLSSQQKLTL